MVQVIHVAPEQSGWAVRVGEAAEALSFLTGGEAERAARRMGSDLAGAGCLAEVRIYLRDGVLAGRVRCLPETGA